MLKSELRIEIFVGCMQETHGMHVQERQEDQIQVVIVVGRGKYKIKKWTAYRDIRGVWGWFVYTTSTWNLHKCYL